MFPPQFTQITVLFFDFKNYLNKPDLHWMFLPWLALQGLGFWLPWFWCIQDRSWRGLTPAWVKAITGSNWVSSRCWCIGCASGGESGWLWFGTLTTNLHFASTLFCHISQIDNRRVWMSLSSFFCHGMFSNSWYFPTKSHLIVIFFSLFEFLVATA